MRAELMEQINNDNQLKRFLRENPNWYRILSRSPAQFNKFEIHALDYFQASIPHRVERFANNAQMASMLVGMLQTINK